MARQAHNMIREGIAFQPLPSCRYQVVDGEMRFVLFVSRLLPKYTQCVTGTFKRDICIHKIGYGY